MKPFDKIIKVRSLTGLSSSEKVILLILATHVGKNENCFLSLDTLAEETGIQRRHTVIKYIDRLVERRIIDRIPPSNGFKSNRYAINFRIVQILIDEQEKLKYVRDSQMREVKNAIQNRYRSQERQENVQKRGVPNRDMRSPYQGHEESPIGTGGVPHRDPKRKLKEIEKKVKDSASLFLPSYNLKSEKQKPSPASCRHNLQEAAVRYEKDPSKRIGEHLAEIIQLSNKAAIS